MPAEPTQQLGRDGVAAVKRWLEATTYIELPFDSYNNPNYCTVYHLNGNKLLDLNGHFLTGNKEPIYVEGKRYTTAASAGNLYSQFQEFLAVAYSVAALQRRDSPYPSIPHWFWVTYHPFKLDRWAHMESADEMRSSIEAVDASKGILNGLTIDENLLREVAANITVLVYNPKMANLSMTAKELKKVSSVIKRKANEL